MKTTASQPGLYDADARTKAPAEPLANRLNNDPLRKAHLALLPMLFGIALMVGGTVKASEIAIFTRSDLEITGIAQYPHADRDIRLFRIDAIDQIEKRLSLELPKHSEQARKTALKRLQALPAIEEEHLREAAEGLLLARQLGVTRIPAIVFDQAFVIYGVTDLGKALALFNRRQGDPG